MAQLLEIKRNGIHSRRKKQEFSLTNCDPLKLYFQDLNQYRLLTKNKEKELAIRVKVNNDKKAFETLVTSNLRLVVKIAIEYNRYWTQNLLDLIQEGNLGLLHAATKFDPHRGTRFSYYASFWIRAYVLKFIIDNWKIVKIGTTQAQRKLFFNLNKERERLLSQGILPETHLLAKRLDVKEQDVIEMSQRVGGWDVSANMPLSEDSNESFESCLKAPDRDLADRLSEKMDQRRLYSYLKRFRRTLVGREAEIYDKRVVAENPETLQVLGKKYHISRERVRQIQKGLIMRLRGWLREQMPDFETEYAEALHS